MPQIVQRKDNSDPHNIHPVNIPVSLTTDTQQGHRDISSDLDHQGSLCHIRMGEGTWYQIDHNSKRHQLLHQHAHPHIMSTQATEDLLSTYRQIMPQDTILSPLCFPVTTTCQCTTHTPNPHLNTCQRDTIQPQ